MHNNTNLTSTEKRVYLKRKRMELGMTQKQFAEMLCIKHGTYVKYETTSSGTRNVSDKLFEDMKSKIKKYEEEHKRDIVGKIIISRYLEDNRDLFMLSLLSRYDREVASIVFNNILDVIRDIEKRAKVPHLMVRK